MELKKNISNLETNWKEILLSDNDIIQFIENQLKKEIENFEGLSKIFPPEEDIFKAFNYFNIEDTKIVILGQDCYHGEGQAHGLCFSVQDNIKLPPSLRNIYKELESDINFISPKNGNLTKWAEQGILLLNSSLTVRESSPCSHIKLWEKYTDNIIKKISDVNDKTIFILWGNFAKKKKKLINTEKHIILEANHPSPLSANRGGWFGCKHFSKSNEILESLNKDKIDWSL